MNPNNALDALKDIHTPPPVSCFPPAPGWYVLALLLVIVLIAAGKYALTLWKKHQHRKALLQEIKSIREKETAMEVAQELSSFLRRLALHHNPRESVASLQGEAWLDFLDKSMGCDTFTKGAGRILLTAPYEKNVPEDIQEIFPWVEKWISKR